MIKHEEVREIVIWGRIIHQDTEKARETLLEYIAEQEKNDVIIQKVKDILALNYSYQEIGFKIRKLFKQLEDELK